MMLYSRGSPREILSAEELRAAMHTVLAAVGPRRRVAVVPPDITRFHSQAGLLTAAAWEYLGDKVSDVLPAIGTHAPMSPEEIRRMFGRVPAHLFRVHDFRTGCVTLGTVPAEFVAQVSEGRVEYDVPIQVDQLLAAGGHDLILSIGQVVPHEVVGMANHAKNVFVGTGGAEAINKTHFLGAAYGMERIMGRADTPVRRVLDYGSEHFAQGLPLVYVLTVVGLGAEGRLVVRGLFAGDDTECFHRAAELSLRVNFDLLDAPLEKVVVYLDPSEYRSTWLGNKSIYRTRMALADRGELIVLAPGVAQFGEDRVIDRLIRRYGYVGTPKVLDLVRERRELQDNLSAAAHLIHGSSEGRFTITYCPGGLSREEIEHAGFGYAAPADMMKRYDPGALRDGMNTLPDGERVFFISNPALGLWALRGRSDSMGKE
jgi:nickel-dependent lactate racemase